MMKRIERFQALLDGKKLRLVEWKAVEWFWELDNNNSYIKNQDGEAIGGYWRLLSDEQEWELYEEPKPLIKLTPEDVGKRVRLRNGIIEILYRYNPNKYKYEYKYETFSFVYNEDGKESGGAMDVDIVEVLS